MSRFFLEMLISGCRKTTSWDLGVHEGYCHSAVDGPGIEAMFAKITSVRKLWQWGRFDLANLHPAFNLQAARCWVYRLHDHSFSAKLKCLCQVNERPLGYEDRGIWMLLRYTHKELTSIIADVTRYATSPLLLQITPLLWNLRLTFCDIFLGFLHV